MTEINPYESPREPGITEAAISPKDAKIARNIRAICFLYIVFGGLGVLVGVVGVLAGVAGALAGSQEQGLPPLVACLIGAVGFTGVVSAIGVLHKRTWGVPICQIVSALYLLSFPIGTLLGAYFLLNIGKVKKQFI